MVLLMKSVVGLHHSIPAEGLWQRGTSLRDSQHPFSRTTRLRVASKKRSRIAHLAEVVTKIYTPICSTSGRVKQTQRESSVQPAGSSRFSNSPRDLILKAIVTLSRKPRPSISEQFLDKVDAVADRMGFANILLRLVSKEIDPKTGVEKRSKPSALRDWAEKVNVVADKLQYTVEWTVPMDFGSPGAVVVLNNHQNEFYLESISIRSSHNDEATYFPCNSWIQPDKLSTYPPTERVFFSNEVHVPSATPPGLRVLREKELKALRGDGKGARKDWERIYDYATYNDLGDPDKGSDLARPTLGGNSKLPYPRRCRTGRPPTKTDPNLESRVEVGGRIYVPRDECFDPIKESTFIDSCMKGLMHKLAPAMFARLTDKNFEFSSFGDIDKLYSEGIPSSMRPKNSETNETSSEIFPGYSVPNLIRQLPFIGNSSDSFSKYPLPELLSKDKFAWMRDEEFGRQMLAGQNPSTIECLKVFPPVSELDPEVYGNRESAMTAEQIEGQLEGLTVEQALQEKKLFILDYHDLFMPFVNAINNLEGRKTYATRTLFFLDKENILKPLAIELSLPPATKGAKGSQRVFTPGNEPTNYWLWQLAKAHVCSNDSGHHQLVSHWLRTHACTEPYIIATHRQLSTLHPISKFLRPHLRYTMEINGAARMNLIAADGVIASSIDTSEADPVTKLMFKLIGTLSLETCFTPGKYCMEMSSAVYKQKWRFDMEALPADLIRRGMAEKDANSPHGLKLMIDDYPYAADGLLLWSALEEWVGDYVNIYYGHDARSVVDDYELQKWWAEIRYVGHADKKHEPWWPQLETKEDLVQILTTMLWMTSGHHAAVNFGQFTYGGYIPNHPCLTRKLVPEEGTAEFVEFIRNPQSFFLSMLPNQEQATVMMMIIEALSAHSPDEEYLGERKARWTSDRTALDAFKRFTETMRSVETEIERRNKNSRLKNRNGAGVPPYELLFPRSGPGITGRGVPNSVSI
ncbi:protein MpLOX9 [Marchantia polymorpha subsp. ruderalis]